MALNYQHEVGDHLDYHNTKSPYGFTCRGPIKFDSSFISSSISFIGAAQSYGVWCEYPFPRLVANALSANCFNLGHAGAGPKAFMRPQLIEAVNQSQLCVIQVMSGRSVSNRYMHQINDAAMVRLDHPMLKPESLLAHNAYAKLLAILSREEMDALINESLQKYFEEYSELAKLITVPKILLWISARDPSYNRDYSSAYKLLGAFPHLVDKSTYEAISSLFQHNVMAVSRLFLNRPIWSESHMKEYSVERSWGNLTSYSISYTHPYLHVCASHKLLNKIAEMGIF